MRKIPILFGAALFLMIAAGCSRNTAENTAPAGATPAPPAQQQQQPPTGQLPPGHPPIDPAAGQGQMAPQGQMMPQGHPPAGQGAPQLVPPQPGAGTGQAGISWKAPQNWVSEVPSAGFRRAQYKVPGPGGDGECVVFYFGPNEGGDPKSNAARWIGMFHKGDGTPVPGKTSELKVGEIPVTMVEAAGTYAGMMGMGGGGGGEKPNYALLGAIAAGPDSNWFFKFTGPEATVKAQRSAFEEMIRSLKRGA